MALVQSITTCGTAGVRGLSRQIIAGINLLAPGLLVNIEDIVVAASPEQNGAGGLFLQSAAKEGLREAIRDRGHGERPRVTSAYRTIAQQLLLREQFEQGRCGIGKAARPGRSNHEDGTAMDVQDHGAWRPFLEAHGWDWFGPDDPVHFTFVESGTRGDVSEIGIRAFQRLWNKNHPDDLLPVDGVFGSATEARLRRAPAAGWPGQVLLRRTDPPVRGEAVRSLQRALVREGVSVPVTGTFGPQTEAAVRAFQKKEGLAVDGIVGPATRRALGL